MGEDDAKKVAEEEKVAEKEAKLAVSEEKSEIPGVSDNKDSDFKPSSVDQKAIAPVATAVPEPEKKKISGGLTDRDVELARLEQEKNLAVIKAWEESEKTKAQNKACKKLADVESWENTKKASIEAELRKIEERLEIKKAEYVEKMKNKMAEIHKLAEEKRAGVEAQKGELLIKAEESAAKYRASGQTPKKCLGCF